MMTWVDTVRSGSLPDLQAKQASGENATALAYKTHGFPTYDSTHTASRGKHMTQDRIFHPPRQFRWWFGKF